MDFLYDVKERLMPTRQYDLATAYTDIYGNDYLDKRGYQQTIKDTLTQVSQGHTLATVRHQILSSQTFTERVLRNDDPLKKLTFIFNATLKRKPTTLEVSTLSRSVGDAVQLNIVVQHILRSEPYRSQVIENIFREVLNRPVKPDEQKQYLDRLAKGEQLSTISHEIKNSAEAKALPSSKRPQYTYNGKSLTEALKTEFSEADIVKGQAKYSFEYSGNHFAHKYADNLPAHFDGLVLEGGNHWVNDPLKAINSPTSPKYIPDQTELIKAAVNKNIPIVFADVAYKDLAIGEVAAGYGLTIAETFLGAKLIDWALRRNARSVHRRGISRRRFLQAGALLTGAWLAAPTVDNLALTSRSLSLGFNNKDISAAKEVSKAVEPLHPELATFARHVRNAVIAEKEEWLQKQWGGNKHLVTAIGAGHVGLESEIKKTSVDRLRMLSRLKPYLHHFVNEPASLYTIAIIRKDTQGQFVVEKHIVPELYQLFKDIH